MKVRDGFRCQVVPGCPQRATVVDHIVPVYIGMADDLFYGEGNLRASCQAHNKIRGFERAAGVVSSPDSTVVSGDYS